MKNVFGYPEFDAEGEEILCTYDNAYSDMLMDIRVYRMERGRKRGFCRRGEETAVLLLSGTVTFGWEGRTETVSRRDVFTDGPYALHACAGEEITVEAQTDAEILVQCTKNDTAFSGRLYRPEEGHILLNGVDIFEYEHGSYLASIAAVFQDYKLFAFSIDENITGKRPGSDLVGTGTVIRRVGLNEKMAELNEGVYSMLGKSYDENGVELSGGERQKVAIARALYKNAPVIILDEPTSALDPLAEAEIYENFNSLIGDKTAIYISHRMSSSVFCDRILLLDGGTVSDFDTHTALMEKADGLYYKLFNAQAENYRIEKKV